MLDKLNLRLINVLNDFCEDANYKILEISKILERMTKFNLDYDILTSNLNYLQEYEYLDIKYLDKNEVALALLPKARLHSEEMKEERKTKFKYYRLALISSVGSFISAFLGGLIASLLF